MECSLVIRFEFDITDSKELVRNMDIVFGLASELVNEHGFIIINTESSKNKVVASIGRSCRNKNKRR